MNNKTFLENLLKEINEDVVLEAPQLVKNPLDRNNNQTDVPNPDDDDTNDTNNSFTDTIGIVLQYKDGIIDNNLRNTLENKFLRNGFYVHGKAGIFNELNYKDESFDNQILPTK